MDDYTKSLYFDWICGLVCGPHVKNYNKLLERLFETEFYYINPMDENRANDGYDLRYRFAYEYGIDDEDISDSDPCSVLEMMVALAYRCEETIMDDMDFGDRTGQWFWNMIVSLGLGQMTDERYDEEKVDYILDRFLKRQYDRTGKGGLFTVPKCKYDLREEEIWFQMCWYLDEM